MNTELREELELLSGWDIPKCDVLEFLLEKLSHTPTTDPTIQDEPYVGLQHSSINKPAYRWSAKVFNGEWYEYYASDNRDAACKLAIKLFKEGILTK